MKSKLVFFIVFALSTQIATAQVFGIKGGLNLANMTFSASGMDFSPKSILGFHVGPVVEFELQENLCFNAGLLYSINGYKIKTEILGQSMEQTSRINTVEIPLNVAYKFSAGESAKLFIQAGPYLGYALSGKTKSGGKTQDIDFKNDGMKRIDYGVGVGIGLELGPIVPSVSYLLGIANLSDNSDVTVKNKVIQLSVALMLGK